MNKFYDFQVLDINGKMKSMQEFAGNLVLIVNTASHCGFTKQYEGLERLYQKYQKQGLIVLGFPCNQFAAQEPGTEADIQSFCQLNYGVTFPMFSKVKVNGREAHPLFVYLKAALPDILGGRVKWNFTKFLVARDGQPLQRFTPVDSPDQIEKYLLKNKLLTNL